MRQLTLKLLLPAFVLLFAASHTAAQPCGVPTYQFGGTTNFNQTVINLPCGQNCTDIKFQVPHIKETSDYLFNSIPYNPYPYVVAGGTEDPGLYIDDRYSGIFGLPFPFCFYDSLFSNIVVGSNGLITFETGNAGCSNAAWNIAFPLPHNSGLNTPPCTNNTSSYPKASIMGVFSDLDPGTNSSPSDKKIQWRSEGVAPCRRFVVSYYHIGPYTNTSCGVNPATATTFQIVLYESSGLIDIFVQNKSCNGTFTNGDKAILGIHDWTRTKWVAAPGKNGVNWGPVPTTNEGFRFTPSAGSSRFVQSQIFALGSNTPIANGDTSTTTAGILDIKYANFCQAAPTGQYLIRTFFSSCSTPGGLIFSEDTITINRTTNLNATATATATGCGAASGTITVTVPPTLGSANFTYILDGGAPQITANRTYTFTNVSGGPHSVYVTDATGCNSTIPITVAVNGNLTVNATPTSTSCTGVNNGSITITPPAPATAPLQYSINAGPYQPSNIFTNLGPGTYSISVQDAGGCSGTGSVTITSGPPIAAAAVATATTCSGAANGIVTVTPSSGNAPYQYSLNGAAYQASNVFTGLQPNSYTVVVKDANGCTSNPISVIVANGPLLSYTVATTPTTCSGVNNGTITITPTAGTGPYQFFVDNLMQTTGVFTSLPAGPHNVTFKDASGCTSGDFVVNIAQGAGITGNANATPASCNGVSNGTITVTATSGSAPYQYSLDGTSYVATNIFSGVAAGNHTVVIQDALGCTSNPINVTVATGAGPSGTTTTTPASCAGVSNGIINATGSAGTAPYQYSLDGGAYQASGTFTGLPSGSHTLLVKDANGCTSNAINVNVTAGAGPSGNATSSPTSCNGVNNGTITATGSGGTGPYQFSLDGGVYSGTNIFNGVSAGNHTVTVKDANGCISANIPVTVAAGAGPSGTATSTATSCNSVSNGTITATGSAGTSPYQYSLDGGAYQAAATFNGVSAGNHTVTVKDAAGCISANIPVTVAAGAGPSGTATSVATSCTTSSNGSITATGSAGTMPYQYSLDGGAYQAGATFTNVASGAHTILVQDATGCISASIPVTVAAGPAITGTATSVATACPNVNNGSITVTPSANATTPQYSLDGGAFQASATFTNVAAGAHNVVIQDAAGCTSAQIPVTVASGSALLATTSTIPASCSGVNNGTITVTPTNGSAPFQYILDGGAPQAGSTFTGVAAGTHTVTVNDASGCVSAPMTVNVTSGSVTGTVIPVAASCSGVSNGSITVVPSNGTPPYQYSLDGGPWQTAATFTGVAAGNHSVSFMDALGCTAAPINVQLGAGPGVTGTATSVATSCSGVSNGSITVNITTGNTPYQYSLDGGASQASNIFTNVSAGAHSVVVTDAAGCISAPINVTVATGAGVSGSATSSATSCNGAANGSVTATATGGTAPYQYSLDGGVFQGAAIFNGVSAGNHTVIIRDAVGCITGSIPVTVAVGPNLNVTVNAVNTSCNGASNGSITLTPTNGNSPYQYSLNAGAPQTGNVFNGLSPASYTITVTDANGCVANNLPATIMAGPSLTATVTTNNVTCNGSATGSFNATINAPGTAPYQYSLNNVTFLPSGSFTGLGANTYTLYLRDNLGCTGNQQVTITEPAVLNLTTNVQAVTCNGQSNGTITVTGTGGVTPYQYSLNNVTYQSSNIFNVAAGTYPVYIKDANGCIKSLPPVTVTQPAVVTLSATTQNASCNGGADGVITATAGGGTGAYQYSIDGVNFQASNIFNVVPNNYTVTVKDVNGCTQTFPVTVGLTNNLTLAMGTSPTICEGKSVQLSLTSNANQYSWTPAATLNNASIANPTASPVTTTQYTVTATLGQCSTTGNVTVSVNAAPIANAGAPLEVCYGQDAQLSGFGGVSYLWSPATYLDDPTLQNPTAVLPQQSISYSLTVTDANGCSSLTPAAFQLTVTPPIQVTVSPKDTIVSEGDVIILNATSVATNYTWSNAGTLTGANTATPTATMPAGSLGNIYTYTVTASTAAGCQGNNTVTLRVYKGPDIYVPSAFTPNGDGKNDIFKPIPVGVKQIKHFSVFNRNGLLVYTTANMNEGWDGRYAGVDQPGAVYVWVVEAITRDNKKIVKKGTVALIR